MYLIIGYNNTDWYKYNYDFIAKLARANRTTVGVFAPRSPEDEPVEIPNKVTGLSKKITYEAVFVLDSTGYDNLEFEFSEKYKSNLWVAIEPMVENKLYPDDIIYLSIHDKFCYMGGNNRSHLVRLGTLIRKLVTNTYRIHITSKLDVSLNVERFVRELRNMITKYANKCSKSFGEDYLEISELAREFTDISNLDF